MEADSVATMYCSKLCSTLKDQRGELRIGFAALSFLSGRSGSSRPWGPWVCWLMALALGVARDSRRRPLSGPIHRRDWVGVREPSASAS